MLLNKTFVFSKKVSTPGSKVSKDRMTFMPCSMCTGTHKLDLLLIGKATSFQEYLSVSLLQDPLKSWVTRESKVPLRICFRSKYFSNKIQLAWKGLAMLQATQMTKNLDQVVRKSKPYFTTKLHTLTSVKMSFKK